MKNFVRIHYKTGCKPANTARKCKRKPLWRNILFLPFFMLMAGYANAQNCTVNAGVNQTTCNSSLTLSGNSNGNTTGSVTWSVVSGPIAPTIASPHSLTTGVTGMTTPGVYIFQLAQPCSDGDTAKQTVTDTIYSQPLFTVSPNRVYCDSSAMDTLVATGTTPTGWTGKWVAYNAQYGVDVSGSFVFSAINSQTTTVKWNNPTICGNTGTTFFWQVTSPNGMCTYNSPSVSLTWAIHVTNSDFSHTGTSCGPGSVAHGPTSTCYIPGIPVTISLLSAPAGFTGTLSGSVGGGTVFNVAGFTTTGTYTYNATFTGTCESKTISFTDNILPPAPIVTATTGGTPKVCYKSAPSSFVFTYTLSDSTAVPYNFNNTTSPSGVPFNVTETGAGHYTRTLTATPNPTWKPGIYTIRRYVRGAADTASTNPNCPTGVLFTFYVLDTVPANLYVATANGCISNGSTTTTVSATMPANPSPNTISGPSWLITKISGPPSGSAQYQFAPGTASFTNLTTGVYKYRIEPYPGGTLTAEMACAGGAQADTFTINVYNAAQSNAGSNQTIHCLNNFSLAANVIPNPSYGTWSQVSGPSTITFDSIHNANAKALAPSGSKIGSYVLRWTVSDSNAVCTTAYSDVTITTDSACNVTVLPLNLLSFTGTKQASQAVLDWNTANEVDFKGFTVQWGTSGGQSDWSDIGQVAALGTGSGKTAYRFVHQNPVNGDNFYRLKMVDQDGRLSYSGTVDVQFANLAKKMYVFPNPVQNRINVVNAATGSTIGLYSIDGRLLVKQTASNLAETVDMGSYPEGVYILTVTDTGGKVTRFSIVK